MELKTRYTEEQLVEFLQKGSKDAFEYLYENYSNTLYGVIYRIVNDEEIARDLVQEVFVKIWKNIQSYSSQKGRIYTWMLNIARNAAIDKLRSKSFGLENVLKQLDENQILLIQKVYFEGYTQAELAEEMEIPLGTIKTRIRKAIKVLREKLAES